MQKHETRLEATARACVDAFYDVMKPSVRLEDVKADADNAWFQATFVYKERNLRLSLESEMGLFVIEMMDEEGAKNSLYRLERFDNATTPDNVRMAAGLLKKLRDGDIPMFVSKVGKLYKKSNEERKRVRSVIDC